MACPRPCRRTCWPRSTNGFRLAAGAYRTQPFEYVTNDAPAGALSASANDMAAYMQALLDPEIMAKAGVLKSRDRAGAARASVRQYARARRRVHGFFDLKSQRGRRGFGHGGSLVFQKSTMEIYPDEGVAIFVSVNTPTGEALLQSSPGAFARRFLPSDACRRRRPPRMRRGEAAKVAGTYLALRLPIS